MIFKIPEKEIQENIIVFMKRAGYSCLGQTDNGLSFVRCLNRERYPRFHIIIREDKGKQVVFDIHLDQKKTVYRNSKAHSADYNGFHLENEAQRIQQLI